MLYNPYNILGLVILVFDIIAVVSLIGGTSSTDRKVLWTLAIVLLPLLGMLLYFFIGRNRQDKITV
jgi:peptidoglycan/LPS O-acetylase OafA/YrhL